MVILTEQAFTPQTQPRMPVRLAPAFVVVALIASCPLQTQGNTIALSFTGGNVGATPNFTLGWAFTLSSPVLLTDLGVWDRFGTGLAESHLVSVWTSTGTQVVGAQGTVSPGAGPTFTNGFRYVSILPVLLPAGNYTIGAFYPTSIDALTFVASTIATTPGVTYDGSRAELGNAFPPGTGGNSNSYFGPNFQFIAVPEASTVTLLLLGAGAMFGLKFFVRCEA
jgi:hypothetical protein